MLLACHYNANVMYLFRLFCHCAAQFTKYSGTASVFERSPEFTPIISRVAMDHEEAAFHPRPIFDMADDENRGH